LDGWTGDLCETPPVYNPLPSETSELSTGAIVGIAFGAVAAVLSIAALATCGRKLWSDNGYKPLSQKEPTEDPKKKEKKPKDKKADSAKSQ
jgi:hypothetical protein